MTSPSLRRCLTHLSLVLSGMALLSCDGSVGGSLPPNNQCTVHNVAVTWVGGSSITVGETRNLNADIDETGNCDAADLHVSWGSSQPSYLTAAGTAGNKGTATGVLATGPAGFVQIYAVVLGVTGSLTTTVVTGSIASLAISPTNPTVPSGTTQPLTAIYRNSFGGSIPGNASALSWSIPASSSSVATINSASGVVTAGSTLGNAVVTATYTGAPTLLTATTTVTVSSAPQPVASIEVSPVSASLNVGASMPLVATVKDPQGNTLTGRDVTWESLTPGVVTALPSSGLTTTLKGISAGGPVLVRVTAAENSAVHTDVLVTVVGCLRPLIFADDFSANTAGAWTTVFTIDNGGHNHTATYQAANGFPGGYREMAHNMIGSGSLYVYHRFEVEYDPSLPGNAIHHINYTESQISLSPSNAAVGWGFFLEQNGVRHLKSTGTAVFSSPTWQNNGIPSMTAADFPGATLTAGGKIKFGFYRANTSTSGIYTNVHGIDNFSVQVCRQ